MFSTVVRIGAVVLALAQLGVWGFYAPAHRLAHHSSFATAAKSEAATGRSCSHASCCAHGGHSAKHSHSDRTHAPTPGCPDDAEHCVFCVLALQQAQSPEEIAVAVDFLPVLSLSEVAAPNEAPGLPTAFDSRGPPSAEG